MSQSYPSILTDSYFEQILVDFLKLQRLPTITNLKIEPCNGKGDGFLSNLFRISIDFKESETRENLMSKKISLVVKCECTNEFALKKIGKKGFDVQGKEMKYFQYIAPKMVEIFNKSSAQVLPKVIKVDTDYEVLIFEDLAELNYKTQDRLVGMDEDHIKISLDRIAKFQAASLRILKENSKAFDNFQTGIFGRNFDYFDNSVRNLYDSAVDEISTWEGFEKYGQKMGKIRGDIIEKLKECFDINPQDFNVLNHGDLWTTNLMYKYFSSGSPEGAVLIDFQFSHYASSLLDLIHFLFTSLNDDLYNPKDIQRFIKIFYHKLIENVKDFNDCTIKIPSFAEYMNEFHGKLFYGLIYTICIFPLMTSDDEDNDFITHHENVEKSMNFRKRVLKAERYQKNVKKMLPYFDAMGLLD